MLGDGKYDEEKAILVDIHIEMFYPKEINALVMLLGPMGKVDMAARGYCFGQRVDDAEKADEAIMSEAYRPGYVNIKGKVAYPGTYTVVLSTYSPDTMVGPFRATVACSMEKLKVSEVRSYQSLS